ncbi:hypothetical protein [Endozoicomonas sp. 4G]|uniref:hypothetical protein n=1 Tax=Endozoicomonas sp. 4G TaxID=2872754 RepID=UPI002078B0A6|nr:hypothetical protein [Endozoicomonas sp. 4G]
MMNAYKWVGWGFLPLMLSKDQIKKILSAQPWKHWTSNLSPEQIKDIRRFYTRPSAEKLRPLDGGRYFLKMDSSSLGQLHCSTDQYQITLERLQLLVINDVCLLYFHVNSSLNYEGSAISSINRSAFSWQPKTKNSHCTNWKNKTGDSGTLYEHICKILTISLENDDYYSNDVFGHELINCSWIKSEGELSYDKLCISQLSAGIDLSNPRYTLSNEEIGKLRNRQFSHWKDWCCQFNLNRFVFLDQTPGVSSLQYNLFEYHYYLDLFAMVIFQRISLNHYKDELILGSKKSKTALFKKISRFRSQYRISHISTYPFAQKLYQYLCDEAELDKIEEKSLSEIEYSYALWRQEKQETNDSVLMFISLIAALLLPASSLATIFALNNDQMGSLFWFSTALVTIITFLAVAVPPIRKYIKDYYSKY